LTIFGRFLFREITSYEFVVIFAILMGVLVLVEMPEIKKGKIFNLGEFEREAQVAEAPSEIEFEY